VRRIFAALRPFGVLFHFQKHPFQLSLQIRIQVLADSQTVLRNDPRGRKNDEFLLDPGVLAGKLVKNGVLGSPYVGLAVQNREDSGIMAAGKEALSKMPLGIRNIACFEIGEREKIAGRCRMLNKANRLPFIRPCS